jgi:Beta-lactamase
MLLVQDRWLNLDEPVGRDLEEAPAAWQPITVRHLLTHTAELVRESPLFDPKKATRRSSLRCIKYRSDSHLDRSGSTPTPAITSWPRSLRASPASHGRSSFATASSTRRHDADSSDKCRTASGSSCGRIRRKDNAEVAEHCGLRFARAARSFPQSRIWQSGTSRSTPTRSLAVLPAGRCRRPCASPAERPTVWIRVAY